MNSYIDTSFKAIEKKLQILEKQNSDILDKTKKGIQLIKDWILDMKDHLHRNDFSSQEKEIHFFKVVKPKIVSKMMVYNKLRVYEVKKRSGNIKSVKKYLNYELNKLSCFTDENFEFYNYMQLANRNLDAIYFTRHGNDIDYIDDFNYFNADLTFSTSHDHKAALVLSHDHLTSFYRKELAILNKKSDANQVNLINQNCRITWTGSKVSLIELIYALHENGCINKGNVEIKDIASFFENALNISLGDYYRSFLEIKNRAIPGKFIESLNQSLINRIEQQDE